MQNSPSPDLKSVVEQARELLADEYEAEGFPRIARSVRSGSSVLSSPVVCRAIEKAILTQKDRLDKLTWQPIETAPKDGSYILAIVAGGGGRHLDHQAGRMFVIRHEGETLSEYDLGWSVYPGFGGASDFNFSHWQPLPEPPALTGSHT